MLSTTFARSREVARTITDYTLWFLTKHLNGNTNFGSQSVFAPLAACLPSSGSKTTFTHTNAPGRGSLFYRVGVEE